MGREQVVMEAREDRIIVTREAIMIEDRIGIGRRKERTV